MNDAPKVQQRKANFVSKVIHWWIFPLLWKGYCKPLSHEDLYPIREVEKSEHRTKLLQEKWSEEILRAHSVGIKPKLWRALLRHYSWQEYCYFLPYALVCVIGDNLKCYGVVTLLNKLTSFNDIDDESDEYFVYVYSIALGCLMKQIGQNSLYLYNLVLAVRARAAILGLLYKKVRLQLA